MSYLGKPTDTNKVLVAHLEDLRKTILISIAAIIISSILVYIFCLDLLMEYMAAPVYKLGLDLVMIGVTEGFMVRLEIAIISGIAIATPVIIWQILTFVMPALYPHEKRLVIPVILSSIIMFILGILFSYFLVLDLALKIMLIDFAGGLSPMISYGKYLSFVIWLLIPFGLVFQIPVIVLILSKVGIIDVKFLIKNRKHVILGAFILAAFLSPGGDMVSQILMAVPIIVLYEISVIIAKLVPKGKNNSI